MVTYQAENDGDQRQYNGDGDPHDGCSPPALVFQEGSGVDPGRIVTNGCWKKGEPDIPDGSILLPGEGVACIDHFGRCLKAGSVPWAELWYKKFRNNRNIALLKKERFGEGNSR